jgi:hypothetical protein
VPELIGARPPAASVAGVARRGAEEGKGSTGVPVPGSPGLRRRWCNGASVVKVAVGRALVRVARGSEMGHGGAVGGGDAGAPFYRVGEGPRLPGVGGERVAAVVRHNGGGGGYFGRGSARFVVGSDEGGCSSRYRSGKGAGWWRACMRGGGSTCVHRSGEEDDWAGPVCQ